jgi:membrane protein insertase, YidC/Oxa1 family, C-terminal domain
LFSVFLTQSGGILGPIVLLLGWILNGIYEFLSLFHIQNVGIVIILFTFITRGLMIPLTIKQQKFTKLSAKMNPEIVKIQNKYKGKKDEASLKNQQLETQAVYEKYGAHPTAGCLPLLIQLPIMFALYKVIYNIPAYVNDIRAIYNNIAVAIMGTSGYTDIMTAFASANHVKVSLTNDGMTVNNIIDILSKFSKPEWSDLLNKFPDISNIISTNSAQILKINHFVGGMNIIDAPGLKFPGILIPILAAALQFVQSKQMMANNPVDNENPMAASMKSMNYIMPIMSGFFCITFQIGVGLYWIAGSAFAIIQQFAINKYMEKVDVDTLIEKNVMKANKKKAKKGIDTGKLEELAKKQTKSIDTTVNTVEEKKSTSGYANSVRKNYEPSKSSGNTSQKTGGIAANANLLKNRNNDKGDK